MVTSVRLNREEVELFGEAARFYGISIPQFIKLAAQREAEDVLDISIADKAHKAYENNPMDVVTWDEFADEFIGPGQ